MFQALLCFYFIWLPCHRAASQPPLPPHPRLPPENLVFTRITFTTTTTPHTLSRPHAHSLHNILSHSQPHSRDSFSTCPSPVTGNYICTSTPSPPFVFISNKNTNTWPDIKIKPLPLTTHETLPPRFSPCRSIPKSQQILHKRVYDHVTPKFNILLL